MASHDQLLSVVQGNASLSAVKSLLNGMSKEELRRASTEGTFVLHHAYERDPAIFRAVLNALDKEAVLQENQQGSDLIEIALGRRGRRDAVEQIVERMRREGDDWNPFALGKGRVLALMSGPLISDREIVALVASLVPDESFEESEDCYGVELALKSQHTSDFAIGVCLERTPIKTILCTRGREELLCLATGKGLAMVKRVHEAMSMLTDGSGRRADASQYAEVIQEALAAQGEEGMDMLAYLVEEGGNEALASCNTVKLIRCLEDEQDLDFVLSRAPSLLTDGCRKMSPPDMVMLMCSLPLSLSESLARWTIELVDEQTICQVMNLALEEDYMFVFPLSQGGWRWRLAKLYEAVPSAWRGRQWECLMYAIRKGLYKDVEYMLTVCTRDHLVKRNVDGDRPCDVALRDGNFPQELLGRLAVLSKSAAAVDTAPALRPP